MMRPPLPLRVFLLSVLLAAGISARAQRRDSLKLELQISDTLVQAGLELPVPAHPHTLSSLEEYAERCLGYLENHGYPFAEVRMYRPVSDSLQVNIRIIANPCIRWDSIVLKGTAGLSPRFLYPYLKIRRGATYSEHCVIQAAAALKSLEYVEMLRAPSPSFTSDRAALYLYLDKRNANSFDGYVGFASRDDGRGLALYGQLNLKLANTFKRGETFSVDWKRPQQNSQTLQAEADLPCLFNTAFGLYGEFSLLKNDTSYYTLSVPVGLRYLLRAGDFLQLYYRYETSREIGTKTDTVQLPADFRKHLYGLRLCAEQTDDARIPHRGYRLDAQGEIGHKTFLHTEETNIPARSRLLLETFQPAGRRWVNYIRLQGGALWDGQMCPSDLFLLGGLHTLRGMDEQSVTASAYLLLSGEMRFFLDRNTFLQAFVDGGWYERKGVGSYFRDCPVGIGLGFSFYSKIGLLSLNYALAAHDGQGFRFRDARICVGYSAVF